ncbi:lectizyme-like [Calliphora vicina]|uniref:lectizyme-like n=1 Tax=Calliphora vicina TaxID=7373 RepID=UPI00325BA5D7
MKLLIVFALTVASVSAANLDFIAQSVLPKGRILNGHEAAKAEAPYIVSLKGDTHFCAGSIIDEHWVLTAAHCLIYDSFEIVAGLHERDDESNVQIRKVSGEDVQLIHDKFMGTVAPYDIGLIYIEEAFDLKTLRDDDSPTVAKINLPSGEYAPTDKATLYGWGRDKNGDTPNTLQTLDVDIIGYTECKDAFPIELGSQVDSSSNICSFTPNTIDGACNGDSGGPLVRCTSDGTELIGIVSWGFIPCTTEYPSVYTMTSAYNDWIQETIANFESAKISN